MKDSKISLTNTVMQIILAEISNLVGYPHFNQTLQILMTISVHTSSVTTSRCSLKIVFNQFFLGTPFKLWAQLAREEQTLLTPCWRLNCSRIWTFRGRQMWDLLRSFRLIVTMDRGPTWSIWCAISLEFGSRRPKLSNCRDEIWKNHLVSRDRKSVV